MYKKVWFRLHLVRGIQLWIWKKLNGSSVESYSNDDCWVKYNDQRILKTKVVVTLPVEWDSIGFMDTSVQKKTGQPRAAE